MTDEVEELLRVLGPFYELVDEKKKITQITDISSGIILFYFRTFFWLGFSCFFFVFFTAFGL